MTQLIGIDVSHHNGTINWQTVKDAGITFAIIKMTQGDTFVDPLFATNLAQCRAVGIVPGVYHFYRHDIAPATQAAHFLRTLGPLHSGDLRPALDVEDPLDGAGPISYPKTEVVHRIGVFLDIVRTTTGQTPIIYTYPAAWRTITNDSTTFSGTNPLWIASYGRATPTLPGGWATYAFWQYTDRGSVPGVGHVDRDRFNGDLLQLDAFRIRLLAIGAQAVLTQDGKIHTTPGLSAPTQAVLLGGTRVTLVAGPQQANGRDWWKVDDSAGAVGWCSAQLLRPA